MSARVVAIAIDGVLVIPTQIVALILVGNLLVPLDATSGDGIDGVWVIGAVAALAAILAPVVYFAVLHTSRWQATVGKKLLGMVLVRHSSGAPVRSGRTLARAVVFMLTVYVTSAIAFTVYLFVGGTTLILFGLVVTLVGMAFIAPATVRSDHRCLHDLLADTVVVDDPRR